MAAEISAQLVRELREQTGAGMMDCKRALQETNGDMRGRGRPPAREGHGERRQARRSRDDRGPRRLPARRRRLAAGRWSPSGARRSPSRTTTSSRRTRRRCSTLVEAEGVDADGKLEERARGAVRRSSARTSRSSAAHASRRSTAARLGAYVHPPANKLGVLVQTARRRRRARPRARDAHLVVGSALDRSRGRPGGSRRRRAGDLPQLRRGAVEARAGA